LLQNFLSDWLENFRVICLFVEIPVFLFYKLTFVFIVNRKELFELGVVAFLLFKREVPQLVQFLLSQLHIALGTVKQLRVRVD
jgi:hypothetical protein